MIDVDNSNFKKYIHKNNGDVFFENDNLTYEDYNSTDNDWLIVKITREAVLNGDVLITDTNTDDTDNLVLIVEDYFMLGEKFEFSDDFKGNVEIYVTDKNEDTDDSSDGITGEDDADFIMNSPQVIAGGPDNTSRLIFYLSEKSYMIVNVNSEFYGYIIGPDANVYLKNGQTELFGAVIAQKIEAEANVQIHFKPPEGTNEIKVESIQFSRWIK